MALRFADSFDHYVTSNISQKWTTNNGMFIQANGRHGKCIGGNGGVSKTLDFQSTWTVGYAGLSLGAVSPASSYTLLALSTSGQLNTVVKIQHNLDNSVSVVTADGTVLGVTPAYDWSGYHFIELKTTLSGIGTATVSATCTLRINTETLIVGSGGCGFQAISNATGLVGANVHEFIGTNDNGRIDDLYITDGNGSVNNGFMGDVKINVIRPNGDNVINWSGTGSSTGTHYLNVNGTGEPDDDTSYVFSTATGSMELYDWEDISAFTGTIKGVQYSVYARKDEEGARVINLVEGTTGTNTITNIVTSKVDIYLNDNYDYHHLAMDTSPTTGLAWTVAGFNADRFGYIVGTNT